jgi:hypothetical protein
MTDAEWVGLCLYRGFQLYLTQTGEDILPVSYQSDPCNRHTRQETI